MAEVPRPHSLSPVGLAIAGWAAFLIAGALFIAIAWNVSSHAPIVKVDAGVASWLHAHAAPAVTGFMLAVTHLNSTVAISVWSVVFAAVLYRMRERYWMLTLALAVPGGLLLNVLLKYAYERRRPHFEDPLITLSTFSFPSGHTAGAVVFYGVLAAFLVSRTSESRKRLACVLGAVAMVVLVAFSRMYLGAHYLSDVLAATCSSTAWLVLCLSSVHALVRRRHGERYERRLLKRHWIALGLAIGASVAAALLLPMRDWSVQFQEWLDGMNLLQAMLVFIAIYVAASVLMLPGGWVFPIAAGVVFGMNWGLPVTLVGATLAALAPFFIARYVIHERVERRAKKHPAFKSVDDAVRKEPWKVVALLRMSPILPSPAKSYFLGLTCVDALTYAWASLLGQLPGLLLKVYLGAAGRDAFSGETSTLKWAIVAAGIAATIAVAIVTSRFAKRRLNFA